MEIDWKGIRLGDFESNFMDEEFQKRLRKTLYYGKNPLTERTSLPVTELAVEFLQHAAPKELGKLDTQLASSISRKACISPCSLMLGLIYIDRLRQKSPEYLQQVSSADLFLVAMMVASKFLYDDGEDGVYNDEWAESAGVGTEAVNALEREFLHAIDWNLLARGEEFEGKLQQLERSVALMKGKERLWKLSYTDLWVFLRNLECLELFKANVSECLKVFGAVLSAYVLGVAVLWISLSSVTTLQSRISDKTANSHLMKRQSSAEDVRVFASNENHVTTPCYSNDNGNTGDDGNTHSTTAAASDGQRPKTRPTICQKWRLFFAREPRDRVQRSSASSSSLPVEICNGDNENAVGRNLKIQENGFNSSFAQEKVNHTWNDWNSVVKRSIEKDAAMPIGVVFG